jgi:hypothetical protein
MIIVIIFQYYLKSHNEIEIKAKDKGITIEYMSAITLITGVQIL